MSKCQGLVLCHGELANGLLSSISCIFGDTSNLAAFSNHGKAIPDLLSELNSYIDKAQLDRIVIFVDLVGGSCWRVAKQIAHEREDVYVFAGVHVPMLVQFVSKFDAICNNNDDWIELLLTKSKAAIQGG